MRIIIKKNNADTDSRAEIFVRHFKQQVALVAELN